MPPPVTPNRGGKFDHLDETSVNYKNNRLVYRGNLEVHRNALQFSTFVAS
jgi:hypothetical protein